MNLCGLCNGDHLAVEFAVCDSEDDVDGVIDTQKAGVDHEVVSIAGSPDLVGIIVEIVPAYFVDIPDLAEEFFIAVEIEALPGLYEPEFLGGVDIDAEYIRVVREDRVGGSSDDYEGFFLSQLSDQISLHHEKTVGFRECIHKRAVLFCKAILPGREKVSCHSLFKRHKFLLIQVIALCEDFHQIAVVQLEAVMLRDLFSDFMAAAAAFSAD